MPRQQVYGKRSRAIYDPFAAFASPQETSVHKSSATQESHESPTNEVRRPELVDRKKEGAAQGTILGEKDANTVVLPMMFDQRPKRRKPKKIIDEHDSDDIVEDEAKENEKVAVPVAEECARTELLKSNQKRLAEEKDVARHSTNKDERGDIDLDEETKQPFDDASRTALALISPSSFSDPYASHCHDLLSLSTHNLTPFSDWSNQLSAHFHITKIAEASFGEVYRLSLLHDLSTFSTSDESVFKVIALTPPSSTLPTAHTKAFATALKRAETTSSPSDVANEVRLLQRMSSTPGFTNFRDVCVLQGRPTTPFIKAFKAFNAEQKRRKKDLSLFPDPAKKTAYADDQLWAVIEMQDAGTDLERFVETRGGGGEGSSIWFVWDTFWQVVLTLAKGEESAEFEHRDLHLGNICVRSPTLAAALGLEEVDPKRKLGFTGLETTIIDYTISRALMPDGTIAYHDLARDPSLFQGDSAEEYQYEIYRYMRSAISHHDPLATHYDCTATASAEVSAPVKWQYYHPITNLVWLHFILYKLLEQVDWPSASKAPLKKKQQQQQHKEAYARWKRANDLEHGLLRVQSLLDPETETGLCNTNGLKAVSDLVGLALTEGWLDVEDVVGADGVDHADDEEREEEKDGGIVRRLELLAVVDEPDDGVKEACGRESSARPARTRRKKW